MNLNCCQTSNEICVLQDTQATTVSSSKGPLPDNEFIMTNQPVERPHALTTCTKAGKVAAAKKRKASTSTTKRTRAGTNKKKLAVSRTDKGEDGTGGANHQQMG